MRKYNNWSHIHKSVLESTPLHMRLLCLVISPHTPHLIGAFFLYMKSKVRTTTGRLSSFLGPASLYFLLWCRFVCVCHQVCMHHGHEGATLSSNCSCCQKGCVDMVLHLQTTACDSLKGMSAQNLEVKESATSEPFNIQFYSELAFCTAEICRVKTLILVTRTQVPFFR